MPFCSRRRFRLTPPFAAWRPLVWTRMNGDGILHITGRIKEIIIRNGVNLSARHIEEA